jgi:hypothetical protein
MKRPERALRISQAARALGTSEHKLRKFCALDMIEHERTPGGHIRIPEAEIERIQEQGLPELPALIAAEDEADEEPPSTRNGREPVPPEELYAQPSEAVVEAAEGVQIQQSRLEKRRIEKDLEETEDWFRAREKKEAAKKAAARQRAEEEQAEQRHRKLIHQWTEYGLKCLPFHHPPESELSAHRALQELLADLDLDQPEHVTTRLVQAAIEKAYAPYRRKEEIKRAIEAARQSLPWSVLHDPKYGRLKECAPDLIAAAVTKLREGADSREMQAATIQAVQPIISEYNHLTACERVSVSVWELSGATSEERERATEAVRKRIAALPVGATPHKMEQEKQGAIAHSRQRSRAARTKPSSPLKNRNGATMQSRESIGSWGMCATTSER